MISIHVTSTEFPKEMMNLSLIILATHALWQLLELYINIIR